MRRRALPGPLFMLNHRFTRARASDYLEGELGARGRRRVERHTHLCPSCHRLIEGLRTTLAALRGLRPQPRTGLADGVIDRLRSDL